MISCMHLCVRLYDREKRSDVLYGRRQSNTIVRHRSTQQLFHAWSGFIGLTSGALHVTCTAYSQGVLFSHSSLSLSVCLYQTVGQYEDHAFKQCLYACPNQSLRCQCLVTLATMEHHIGFFQRVCRFSHVYVLC